MSSGDEDPPGSPPAPKNEDQSQALMNGEAMLDAEDLPDDDALYRSFFELALDGLCVCKGPRMVMLNPQWERMLGRPREELLAKPYVEWVHPDDIEPTIKAASVLDTEGAVVTNFENRYLHADGTYRTLHWRAISKGGFLFSAARDVTAQHEAEQRLRTMRQEAERLAASKSIFLANMSHEIRTPLNGIIGVSQLLVDTDLDDDQQRFAAVISNSGRALLRIVNDILDFSKIDANRLELEMSPFSLLETLDATGDLFALPAAQRGIFMYVIADKDLPDWVDGDQGRLRQILNNLVSNALKFTASGGKVVVRASFGGVVHRGAPKATPPQSPRSVSPLNRLRKLSAGLRPPQPDRRRSQSEDHFGPGDAKPEVDVDALRSGSDTFSSSTASGGAFGTGAEDDVVGYRISFAVTDTGIGIPPDRVGALFTSFFQAHQSGRSGTGLGLAISKRLTALMGGDLLVESEEHKGSTFTATVVLPVTTMKDIPATAEYPNCTVLLVDGCKQSREAIQAHVDSVRASCIAVKSADKAQLVFRQNSINVVIVSASIPNGKDLLERLHSVRPTARFLYMDMMQNVQHGGNAHFEYLWLPVKRNHLLLHVSQAATQQFAESTMRHSSTLNDVNALDGAILDPTPVYAPLPEPPKKSSFRILAVDDNSSNLAVVEMMLSAIGLTCDNAGDGKEAVEMTAKSKYDLVLMDCQMPVMDGWAATEAIRARESDGEHLVIVAMTAAAMRGDRARCLSCGMDDYISKPIRKSDIVRVITAHCPQLSLQSGTKRGPGSRGSVDSESGTSALLWPEKATNRRASISGGTHSSAQLRAGVRSRRAAAANADRPSPEVRPDGRTPPNRIPSASSVTSATAIPEVSRSPMELDQDLGGIEFGNGCDLIASPAAPHTDPRMQLPVLRNRYASSDDDSRSGTEGEPDVIGSPRIPSRVSRPRTVPAAAAALTTIPSPVLFMSPDVGDSPPPTRRSRKEAKKRKKKTGSNHSRGSSGGGRGKRRSPSRRRSEGVHKVALEPAAPAKAEAKPAATPIQHRSELYIFLIFALLLSLGMNMGIIRIGKPE